MLPKTCHHAYMDTFSKSILKVGTYHSPDGVVEVTPERLKHWEAQARRLQAVGYDLPSHFNHASEIDLLEPIPANPLERKLHRGAEFTVGQLERSGFVVAPDGQSAEITLKTLTDGAREAVSKNVVYVSPVIFPEWKDGAGNTYADVITSFDLVDHPVDYSQSSFVPAIRMGRGVVPVIRMGNSKPFILGNTMASKTKHKKRNEAARRARLANAIRMGTMPPDDEADKTGNSPDAAKDASQEADGLPDTEASTTGDDAGPDRVDAVDQVLNLLAEFGCKLPDDTDDSNMIRHLRVALTALLNSQQMEDSTQDPDEMQDTSAGALPGSAGGMPMPSAPSIATMSVQRSAERTYAEKLHRDGIAARIDGLLKTGRCTPHEADQQTRALQAVKLSLTNTGEAQKGDVDKWIESREPVPAGTFWTDKQRTDAVKLSLVPAPTAWKVSDNGKPSQTEIDEGVTALMGKSRK